jgi:hypothetical protein
LVSLKVIDYEFREYTGIEKGILIVKESNTFTSLERVQFERVRNNGRFSKPRTGEHSAWQRRSFLIH